jgi:hypothetical protein
VRAFQVITRALQGRRAVEFLYKNLGAGQAQRRLDGKRSLQVERQRAAFEVFR